jgi:hypothetical protein
LIITHHASDVKPSGAERRVPIRLHYVINQASGDALNEDDAFSRWMQQVAEA